MSECIPCQINGLGFHVPKWWRPRTQYCFSTRIPGSYSICDFIFLFRLFEMFLILFLMLFAALNRSLLIHFLCATMIYVPLMCLPGVFILQWLIGAFHVFYCLKLKPCMSPFTIRGFVWPWFWATWNWSILSLKCLESVLRFLFFMVFFF